MTWYIYSLLHPFPLPLLSDHPIEGIQSFFSNEYFFISDYKHHLFLLKGSKTKEGTGRGSKDGE